MEDPFSPVMPIAKRPPLIFERGEGDWLFDEAGRRYLDFVQGWAVNCLGHAPQPVADALRRQSERLIHAGPGYYSRPMLDLSTRLSQLSGLEHVFLASSGAEANEGAIKLARKWGALNKNGAYEIITAVNGFHGRTLATMSATGKPAWEQLFEPKVPGFVKVPFNELTATEAAISESTVALMVEPVQGEGGVIPANADYLTGLRELADRHDLLLIFDEIQTGIGRTGHLFAHQASGVCPDILTLGKGLGGGVPISAMLTRACFSCFEPGDQGGTFNSNPLVAAAANAVLRTVADEDFLAAVRERSERLRSGLEALSRRHGLGVVRGQGLLQALHTGVISAPAIVEVALNSGMLLNAPRPNVLRFMPALNVEPAAIDEMLERLDAILATMDGSELPTGQAK